MGVWTAVLVAYFVGGVTLIPLVVAAVVAHGYYVFPRRHDVAPGPADDDRDWAAADAAAARPGDDETSPLVAAAAAAAAASRAAAATEPKTRPGQDLEVAAGYFAVCREYTPMGINAKPIERSTPLGSTTVASPSPSVYQTMYRSIFDRKPAPAQDGNGLSQRPKKAGYVFYVVLRHGHLMLFDDDEQLEVRHVISLAHHDISIYSGGDATPEGELFIKRNALCLSLRRGPSDGEPADGHVSKPFYLFSENCSAKEDFYFAMLRNQEQTFGFDTSAPRPKGFDVKSIISLVQRLHSSEDHVHSRWLNAMLGRLFLAVYRTRDLENFIRDKITNKIARVKRPSFLTNITIQGIDTGEAAPYFTNLKLKDLTVEGECVVEADVRYTGNFRIQVGATAKIDLGARFKAREVNLVLAVVLRRVEGHVLFKIKAPPTNRLWFSFQTMPKMEMAIEPIVSSRQITYTVILRQIESRIKEVFAETLVQPFWDDVPFFRTEHKRWRGGIFEGDDAVEPAGDVEAPPADEAACGGGGALPADGLDEVAGASPDRGHAPASSDKSQAALPPDKSQAVPPDRNKAAGLDKSQTLPLEKSQSLPPPDRSSGVPADKGHGLSLADAQQPERTGLFGRKLGRNGNNNGGGGGAGSVSSAATDSKTDGKADGKAASSATSPLRSPVMLRNSTDPIVGTETTHADLFKPSSSPPDHATNYMAALRSRSQDASPMNTPAAAPSKARSPTKPPSRSSIASNREAEDGGEARGGGDINANPVRLGCRNTASSVGSSSVDASSVHSATQSSVKSLGRNLFLRRENSSSTTSSELAHGEAKRGTLAAVTNAAVQARQWGWNAIQRQKDARRHHDKMPQLDLSQPMGRGQPLPPPGVPLPGPTNGGMRMAAPPMAPLAAASKRKPAPEPLSVAGGHEADKGRASPPPQGQSQSLPQLLPPPTPTLPQTRRRAASSREQEEEAGDGEQSVLVVTAPEDSQPGTPLLESHADKEAAATWSGTADDAGAKATLSRALVDAREASPSAGRARAGDKDGVVDVDDDDDYSGWMEDDVLEGEGEGEGELEKGNEMEREKEGELEGEQKGADMVPAAVLGEVQ